MVYRIKWYLISFIPKSTKIISPAMQISLTNKSNTPSTMAGSSECHFFVIIGMRNLTNGFIIAHLVRDKRGDSNAIPSHIAVWGIHRIHIFFLLRINWHAWIWINSTFLYDFPLIWNYPPQKEHYLWVWQLVKKKRRRYNSIHSPLCNNILYELEMKKCP